MAHVDELPPAEIHARRDQLWHVFGDIVSIDADVGVAFVRRRQRLRIAWGRIRILEQLDIAGARAHHRAARD